jgi:tRNA(Arg) A34 adenosine deaminase TadA
MTDERPVPPGLSPFWNGTVQQFAELQPNVFTPEEQERHRIYSLLLMGVIYGKWSGNKYGEIGDYGEWRSAQEIGSTREGLKIYGGGSYLGHNIAALAVDAEGRIIDFDFNHNQVFDSTVEHAESRLVRRVFALNQVYDPWFALDTDSSTPAAPEGARRAQRRHERRNVFATATSDRLAPEPARPNTAAEATPTAPTPYSSLLKDVTIYTSLESCAQCSGIMCLGSVKDIVYLQWDQGQFLVGNIMWQATRIEQMGFTAPRPIRGDEFGFEYFTQLNAANEAFNAKVPTSPFYTGPGAPSPVTSQAVTSFLCTDAARAIYAHATTDLNAWTQADFPTYQPTPSALTNQQALVEAHDFLDWTNQLDNRGAPHRI